jgi:hypothetical protein
MRKIYPTPTSQKDLTTLKSAILRAAPVSRLDAKRGTLRQSNALLQIDSVPGCGGWRGSLHLSEVLALSPVVSRRIYNSKVPPQVDGKLKIWG